MLRAKVSLAEIDKAPHHGLSHRLGYDAKDHMMRVQYRARASEPNWDATLVSTGPAPLPVVDAFIEVLARVKAQYDVDDNDHVLMLRQA